MYSVVGTVSNIQFTMYTTHCQVIFSCLDYRVKQEGIEGVGEGGRESDTTLMLDHQVAISGNTTLAF